MLVCLRIFVVLDVSENQRPNAGQLIQRSGITPEDSLVACISVYDQQSLGQLFVFMCLTA